MPPAPEPPREPRPPAAVLPGALASGGRVGRDLAAVDWAATPLGDPAGWPQSLRSTVRILLTSRFAMWMAWGPELTFLCNDAYRRDTLGRKYPWALGRPAREVWAEIWPDIAPRIERVLTTGEATWDEALMLFLERSGYREETYHTFSYSPLTDEDGVVVGMLCVVSEETERVVSARHLATVREVGSALTALRSEREVLDAAAARLAADQRSLPFTATYLVDAEAVTARLGAASGVLPGAPAAPLELPLGDGGAWPLADVLAGRTAVLDVTARPGLPTGAWDAPPRHVLVVPLRQQGPDGGTRVAGALVAGLNPWRPLDADARGFVELVATQVSSALAGARAYEEERERAERLQELDRAKTAFFTNVSHEVRTPLTLLLGPAEDALADRAHPLAPPQRERVEVVQRNGERLLKLVNTLLDFQRVEAGGLRGRFEPVDLAAATAELAGTFAAAYERAGLALVVDCPPLPGPVHVDREMWAEVVLNLLSNALKHTFEGRVTVRLRAGDGRAVLVVEDTGTGIPQDQHHRLFQRFARVEGAASRSHEGSGIGLALVADLVRAHGGTVAVRSAPGAGSAFEVAVPLGSDHLPADQVVAEPGPAGGDRAARTARGFLAEALRWSAAAPEPDGEDPADPREPARAAPAAAPPAPAPGGRPRVLVVDDNADMRDHVRGLLAADHEVLTARDGREGLALARERSPDLVLSDVMMPRLDGFGLLAALRADPLTARTPVILLSARAGEEATVEGLEAGADDYLTKPFSSRELLARVRANLELERVRRSRGDLARARELLDQAQRLARVGSWEIDLASGALRASTELRRQLQLSRAELDAAGSQGVLDLRVPDGDRQRLRAALDAAAEGEPLDLEVPVATPDGQQRTYRVLGELERDDEGRPVRLRGSTQDVTGRREAERAVARAAAVAEAAARERSIADELQRSLLPEVPPRAEALRVAAYYRAGTEGTQVGGDWFDVIELGAGRTGLVLGDVMGRGVRAAAVMGQLRSAVRAFARLDLPPADVLEHLDGVVRDLGDDQIVTCLYAVHDPYDRVLTWANAGHLPPLVRDPDGGVRRLADAEGPPLGTGVGALAERSTTLEPGALLALYTDGLVERRDSDIDTGVGALAAALAGPGAARLAPDLPGRLVDALVPGEPDDDVAVLLAQVDPGPTAPTVSIDVPDDPAAVAAVRHRVADVVRSWGAGPVAVLDDVLLLLSELVTNGLVHGAPPVRVRLRRAPSALVLEVHDGAPSLPRRMRPGADDEHGRGLQLVALLAGRWGTRPTPGGKAVWCEVALPPG
nr:SpoIIE family protein phosphatase [Vallicoccus soli]